MILCFIKADMVVMGHAAHKRRWQNFGQRYAVYITVYSFLISVFLLIGIFFVKFIFIYNNRLYLYVFIPKYALDSGMLGDWWYYTGMLLLYVYPLFHINMSVATFRILL